MRSSKKGKRLKCPVYEWIIIELDEVHSDDERENNHVSDQTEENGEAAPTGLLGLQMEPDVPNDRLRQNIKEIIVNQDNHRHDEEIGAGEFLVLDVVLTNLFRGCFGIIF
tara:strand:+ start:674 stop:1003 length:330 start_codon:yes stop_codon:yes gene_type:complete